MRRRTFLGTAAAIAAHSSHAQARQATVNRVVEWAFESGKTYRDPFHDVDVDVIVRDAAGGEQRVPCWWAGEQTWRVRYAPHAPGRYTWRTVSTDATNSALHGIAGTLEAEPYRGDHPLHRHGPLRVAASKSHFEHADGTPFFWLGDTWWMGLCRRFRWPEDFQLLAADRLQKGFTVVQIVAGLYPDMPAFDPRGANEAGFPWEKDWARIRPAYFDMADLRIQYLVERGLVPCIVGCWGYYLPLLGEARMKKHWRYLVARWGAYPVTWCLAGEGNMPYYLSANKDADNAAQRKGWTEMGRYLRGVDPFHRPITIHPPRSGRRTVEDPAVLDFDMLQTGHSDRGSFGPTVETVTESVAAQPKMPVIESEVCYEGINGGSREEVQRYLFWACMLSGAAGFTYGANGIWQVNTAETPYGPSPHGRSWGDTPWDVAMRLPGSRQLGLAKALLARYPWWKLEPHPEWIEPHWSKGEYYRPFAAGIPGRLRIAYLPPMGAQPMLRGLDPGAWRAFYFDPATGREHPLATVTADDTGSAKLPHGPVFQDWVLVIER